MQVLREANVKPGDLILYPLEPLNFKFFIVLDVHIDGYSLFDVITGDIHDLPGKRFSRLLIPLKDCI